MNKAVFYLPNEAGLVAYFLKRLPEVYPMRKGCALHELGDIVLITLHPSQPETLKILQLIRKTLS